MNRPTANTARASRADSGSHDDVLARLSEAASEIVVAKAHIATTWNEVEDVVEIANASEDAIARFASAYFRMWHNEYVVADDDLRERNFALICNEVAEFEAANVPIDPNLAILLGSQLSDIWMVRGDFALALQHGRDVHLLATRIGTKTMARSTLASLGFLTCMAGYVNDGISLILRTTADSIDLHAERFIRGGVDVLNERQLAVELADCYEFTRDWRRAAGVLRIVQSLISPGATVIRIQNLWALARCYSRLGQHEMAAELMSQAPNPLLDPGISIEFKLARTLIVQDAELGNTQEALAACDQLIERVKHPSRLNLRKEIADEASRIARNADEPQYCIDVLEPIEHFNGSMLPLLGVLAFRDLAWAYRRLGHPNAARHYLRLAHLGERRFCRPNRRNRMIGVDRPLRPASLISARSIHRTARVAQLNETQSLYRGLGAVVHDLRGPLQSLELAFSLPDVDTSTIPIPTIVESVDQTLDELLRDIEMAPSVSMTDVCVADAVTDVIATFRGAAEHKSVELHTDIATHLVCVANVAMLARIVSNLVSNAIKFSPIGGLVQVTAFAIGADIVDLHVEDSGPGVSDDDFEQLFQWGGRGSAPPTGGESQHGIGLYTANRLATLMGATIRCHTKTLITRSAFSVRLRRAQVPMPASNGPVTTRLTTRAS